MREPIIYDQHLKDEYVELVCLYTNLQYKTAPTTHPEMIETALDRDFINLERDLLKILSRTSTCTTPCSCVWLGPRQSSTASLIST